MKYKVVLASTQRSQSETDLSKMIDFLFKNLEKIENIDLEKFTLAAGNTPPPCDHLILCGYDHITLSHLHLALDRSDRITMYDEPGRSLQTELTNVFYRGVDSSRLPQGVLSAVEYSWSFKDVVSSVKFSASRLPDEPKPRSRKRANSSRQVENTGDTSASEGVTDDAVGGDNDRAD